MGVNFTILKGFFQLFYENLQYSLFLLSIVFIDVLIHYVVNYKDLLKASKRVCMSLGNGTEKRIRFCLNG